MDFEKLLQVLDGKKAMIVAVIATTVSFLSARGILDGDIATFINTIVGIIFGYAEIKTPAVLGARRK